MRARARERRERERRDAHMGLSCDESVTLIFSATPGVHRVTELVVDRITFRWSIIWFRWSIIWPKQFRLQVLFPPYRPKQTVLAKNYSFGRNSSISVSHCYSFRVLFLPVSHLLLSFILICFEWGKRGKSGTNFKITVHINLAKCTTESKTNLAKRDCFGQKRLFRPKETVLAKTEIV